MKKGFIGLLGFVALVAIAFLIFTTRLLPVVGIKIGGSFINLIATVQDILVLIIVGLAAFSFAAKKGKVISILFWASILIFIVGSILLWVK